MQIKSKMQQLILVNINISPKTDNSPPSLDIAIWSLAGAKLAVCSPDYCPWLFIVSTAMTDARMSRINGLLEALSKPPQARDMIK